MSAKYFFLWAIIFSGANIGFATHIVVTPPPAKQIIVDPVPIRLKLDQSGVIQPVFVPQTPVSLAEKQAAARCVGRILESCYLSKNDINRIINNTDKCKQVRSDSGKTTLEVLLMNDTGKMLVIETEGQKWNKAPIDEVKGKGKNKQVIRDCPTTRYSLDATYRRGETGIRDFKVLGNRFWMVSESGKVFFANADQTFYELLNHNRESYSSVSAINGVVSGQGDPETAIIVFESNRSAPQTITPSILRNRVIDGRVRGINFVRNYTSRSIFRDE